MLETVRRIARCQPPALPPCDLRMFSETILAMASALKRRSLGDISGQTLVREYHRHIGNQPADAIAYLREAAIRELDWFPTVAECLRILDRWIRDDDAVKLLARSRRVISAECEARRHDMRADVAEGKLSAEEIEALPERVRRDLDCANLIRMLPEGRVDVRKISDFDHDRILREAGR